ncbi:MAG: hypothetical protein ACLT29_00620 [Ruminococcus callidus]
MTNTLVSENIEKLQNYSLIFGATQHGKTAIYATLDHEANQKVYNAFGNKNGTAIAYNYLTGKYWFVSASQASTFWTTTAISANCRTAV